MSVSIYLVKERANKTGLHPLYVRVVINGRKKDIKTGVQIESKWWNPTTKQVKEIKRNRKAQTAKGRSDTFLSKIDQIRYQLESHGHPVTHETILDKLGRSDSSVAIVDYCLTHVKHLHSSNQITESTIRTNYRPLIRLINRFDNRTQLRDLSQAWLDRFQEWLLSPETFLQGKAKGESRAQSTVRARLTILKGWIQQAVANKLLSHDPFLHFKFTPSKAKKVVQFLSKDEIIVLQKLFHSKELISHPSLSKGLSRQSGKAMHYNLGRFLFSCYSGLRASDNARLTFAHFGSNGITIKTLKTGSVVRIPFNPNMFEILETLGLSQGDDAHKPVFEKIYSTATMSKHLDQIMKIAGINKKITFHCSRHTFATLALTFGISLKVVSKILGHSTVTVTERYAKVVDKTIDEQMQKWDLGSKEAKPVNFWKPKLNRVS